MTSSAAVAEGHKTVRHGEQVCVYRRRTAKLALLFGGALIFGPFTVRTVNMLASSSAGFDNASSIVLLVLLVLSLVLVIGYFGLTLRVGIETSSRGVRSISASRKEFIEWSDIKTFVVAHYTPLSACVLAERQDGTRVALNGVATWAGRQTTLTPYRDALIKELEEHRDSAAKAQRPGGCRAT